MTIEEEKQEESLAPAVIAGTEEVDAEHGDAAKPDAVPEVEVEPAEPEVEETTDEDADSEELKDGEKKKKKMMVAADAPWKDRMWEVFITFWPLGLIAFGGPQAHVAILRDHLVVQRDWLDEEQFTELFAIGQVRALSIYWCLYMAYTTFVGLCFTILLCLDFALLCSP
jgi:hypothetical protein